MITRCRQKFISPGTSLLLISMAWSTAVLADPFTDGLAYISASQDSGTGTWGAPQGTLFRDSTVVLEMLTLASRRGSTFNKGVAGTADLIAMNNDDLSRRAAILSTAGQDISLQLTALLATQNPAIFDPAQRDFPGRGWGLAAGFGNSTLDTALALRALQAGGFPGVLSIVGENLAAFATGPTRPFTVPAGATGLTLRVQDVAGGTVRFLLDQPNAGTLFVDSDDFPGVPVNINLPTTPGTWGFRTENLDGTPATFTAEMGYTDSDNFNHFRITSALTYLGLAQNPDGGWGLAPGEDSHLMVTAEVIRALAGSGGAFAPGQVLTAAAGWLIGLQNGDGGFSSEPDMSNTNETAMAAVAIALATPAASVESAAAYLVGLQLPNGSWGDDAYLTAIAMQALQAAGQGLSPVIFGSGFE